MRPLTTLWRSIEAVAGRADVDARWRQLLGDDLRAWAGDLLRATPELAECYPKLAAQPGSHRPYRVVHHGYDDVVGVCPVDGRVELTATDLVVYELDVRELAARLADALGLAPGYAELVDPPNAYRVGAFRPEDGGGDGGREVWTYLCLPDGPGEFLAAVTSLSVAQDGPALVLTPTRDSWQPRPAALRGRVGVESLDRVVTGAPRGRFVAACDAAALFAPILPRVAGPPPATVAFEVPSGGSPAMAEGERQDAFGDVTDAYSEWLEELPWIHGDDGERAVCDAVAELAPVRDAVRVLAHHLIARGQAPVADRTERAFERVVALARDIERFVASPTFDVAEWLYGDADGAAGLPGCTPEDVDDLPKRARELVRAFLDEGRTLVDARHEAAFWLAHQMARGRRDVPEVRHAVWELAHQFRANARDKSAIIGSAVARAYGRLELGWAEVARHLDRELVGALDAFWDELRLAQFGVTTPLTKDRPACPDPAIGTNGAAPPPPAPVSPADDPPTDTADDDLDVNEETFTVRCGGRSLTFQPRHVKLFALLARVAKRRGHRVTFDALREPGDVWGDADVEDTTIKGAVSRLRGRLEAAGLGRVAARLQTGRSQGRAFVILANGPSQAS